MRVVAALLPMALLMAACAPPAAIVREADALGLEGDERRRFQREVEACVRKRDREGLPDGRIGVHAAGGADAGSGVGIAAIGVATAVVAAGITYHVMNQDDAAKVEAEGDPIGANGDGGTDAAGENGTAAGPAASAEPSAVTPDPSAEPFVDVCVQSVSARWAAEGR